jgi:hypothetical protein
MRSIYFICWLALPIGALLYGLDGTAAQEVDVRQACTPDAMRLCSEFIPDVTKVTTCMNAKRAQLSQECRSAMAAGHPAARGRQVRRYYPKHYKYHQGSKG